MLKLCPKCSQKTVVKNWTKRRKQAYKCQSCKYRFCSTSREPRKTSLEAQLRQEYVEWKQTYQQLATHHWYSKRTIQRKLDSYVEDIFEYYNTTLQKMSITIIMDCTWFWDVWLFIIRSYQHWRVLYARLFEWDEKLELYEHGLIYLQKEWWTIIWVVTDWFKGIRWLCASIPYQYCQFHQVKTITSYITKYPRNEINRELLAITLSLITSTQLSFTYLLDQRYTKRKQTLQEKSYNEQWTRRRYTHKKTRAAYRSLKTNMDVLFTYLYHHMPNTTNSLDWSIKLLKTKVHIHNWLSEKRKKRLILSLLSL